MGTLISSLGLLAAALSFGALGWFFFIQTPLLTQRLGRDRFVPLQMSLVRPLFRTAAVASAMMLGSSLLTAQSHQRVLAAAAALSLALLGVLVVIPRALRAGGKSLAQPLTDEAQHAAGRFIADGGGEASRVWHRAVAVVTVGIVAAQVAWLVLPSAGEPSPHHAPAPEAQMPAAHARFKADASTSRGVRHLRELVAGGLLQQSPKGAELATQLQATYALIFADCTMTGEAHEALHGFLLPLDDSFKALSVAVNPVATHEQLERLRGQLNRWDETFE